MGLMQNSLRAAVKSIKPTASPATAPTPKARRTGTRRDQTENSRHRRWHHPKSALVQAIKEGTLKLGGGMPAWKGTLTDEDIEAVVSWIQSRWPEDVYKSWALMDEKVRRE